MAAPADAGHHAGSVTVAAVVAIGVSLLALTLVANVVVWQYGRGAVREALDSGARAGARLGAGAQACEASANAVLEGLLSGPVGHGVSVACSRDARWAVAAADVRFGSWLPFVPDWVFRLEAVAPVEAPP